MDNPDLLRGLAFYGVFLFSVVLHEAAHAWAALRGGDPTAYWGGQVTLDPRPHVKREPFGMVVLPLIGVLLWGFPIGFASAPYNVAWADRYPKRAAWMSLAGPAANLLVVLAVGIIIRVGMLGGVFDAPDQVLFGDVVAGTGVFGALALLLGMLFSMNMLLFMFNMIPLPPLDGSGAIPLILSPQATRTYQRFIRQPMLSLIGIIVAWQVFGQLFYPLFILGINVLYFPVASYEVF